MWCWFCLVMAHLRPDDPWWLPPPSLVAPNGNIAAPEWQYRVAPKPPNTHSRILAISDSRNVCIKESATLPSERIRVNINKLSGPEALPSSSNLSSFSTYCSPRKRAAEIRSSSMVIPRWNPEISKK